MDIRWSLPEITPCTKFDFFFRLKVCYKLAIPKVALGNLETNIYTWTCRHFSACCLRSMKTLWMSERNENLFLDAGSWDDLSLFLLLNRTPLQPVPCPKINSLLLTRHNFPKLSLNSHWYNNNPQQSVKQKSAVFYPTFHCLLLQRGNMSRYTDTIILKSISRNSVRVKCWSYLVECQLAEGVWHTLSHFQSNITKLTEPLNNLCQNNRPIAKKKNPAK